MTINWLRSLSQRATRHFCRIASLAVLLFVVATISVPAICFGQDTKGAVKVSQDKFRKEVFVVKIVDVGAQWKEKIEVGDQIVSADGQPINDRDALIEFLQNAGDKPIFIELLHRFQPKTIEVIPKNKKIGIAVANPREYALSNAEDEPVKLASRAELLDDPASSGDGIIQVPPGTIVLSVFTETAGVIPANFLSGNNQGEIWWVKSESVKPKSAVATKTSWLMYLLAAGLAVTIFSQRHRRKISTIMVILVAAVICRLVSDNAARLPIPVTAILFVKLILGVVSIICGLGAFAVTVKWMREPDIDGAPRGGSALGMLLFGLFAGAKLWDVFSQNREREKDQPSELPPHTVEEFVVALRNIATRFNAKPTTGDKKSNISIADDHLSYFGYELRWVLTKRVLCVLGSTSTKIADLLKHAAKMGEDAGYKLIDKALYVKTWKGFVETENGKELMIWDDDNSTRGVAEIVIEEFVQAVNREIGTPEHKTEQKSGRGGDGDESFREWLRSPTWLSVDEAIQQAPGVGLTAPAIEALQLCGGRNVAVSKYGLLVTLERSEAISEAHVHGHGVVAIEQREYPELHRELRAKLQNQGYTVLYNETGKENLLILKATDQYQLLRLMGGVAYMIAEDVIEKMREWDETYKLSLTLRGFAEDWVQADIVAPPDVRSLAEDIHRFCPDIAEHESRPIKAIMGDLTNSQYIHLWWD